MKFFGIKKYISILIILILIDCGIGAFIGVWRESYWNSLSNKEFVTWFKLLSEFCIAALISCLVSGLNQYLINIISLQMRTDLTKKALKLDFSRVEGHQQRIQEDCGKYPSILLNLSTTFIRALIMIIAFSWIILSHIQWYYLLIPILYALFGTLIAGKIAYPLISLNYMNQVFEAAFRQELRKLKYIKVHKNNRNLFIKTKHLQYFQSFFQQITVIFPHLVLASLYFSGRIVFGVFMQLAAAMAEITNSLSIIILSLNDINALISCYKRLKELKLI